ncbi:MAG TPA: hypothetical protein VED37_02650 [Ktedonobacteraceae bacterium]|nr:hypothetical protein [Ktedonobacteraceae bacterium]
MFTIFELQGGEWPLRINRGQNSGGDFRLGLENLAIMIGAIHLACDGAHGPIAHRNQTCHFIPGIVYDPVSVGRLLPVIHLIARHPRLQDQVRVAPHRVERVILHRAQAIKDARHMGWGKVIGSQKAPGSGA